MNFSSLWISIKNLWKSTFDYIRIFTIFTVVLILKNKLPMWQSPKIEKNIHAYVKATERSLLMILKGKQRLWIHRKIISLHQLLNVWHFSNEKFKLSPLHFQTPKSQPLPWLGSKNSYPKKTFILPEYVGIISLQLSESF